MVDGEVDAGKMRGTDKSRERDGRRESRITNTPDDVFFFHCVCPRLKHALLTGLKWNSYNTQSNFPCSGTADQKKKALRDSQ